jgi:hypothetical protein
VLYYVLYVILCVRIELFLWRCGLRCTCTVVTHVGPTVRLSGRVFAVWGRTVLSTGLFIHSFMHDVILCSRPPRRSRFLFVDCRVPVSGHSA